MGRPEMAGKWRNPATILAAAAAFAGLIRARPAKVGHEISWR